MLAAMSPAPREPRSAPETVTFGEVMALFLAEDERPLRRPRRFVRSVGGVIVNRAAPTGVLIRDQGVELATARYLAGGRIGRPGRRRGTHQRSRADRDSTAGMMRTVRAATRSAA